MDKLDIIERDTLYFLEEMIAEDNIFYARKGRMKTLAGNVGCESGDLKRAISKLIRLGYIEKVEGGYYLCV